MAARYQWRCERRSSKVLYVQRPMLQSSGSKVPMDDVKGGLASCQELFLQAMVRRLPNVDKEDARGGGSYLVAVFHGSA